MADKIGHLAEIGNPAVIYQQPGVFQGFYVRHFVPAFAEYAFGYNAGQQAYVLDEFHDLLKVFFVSDELYGFNHQRVHVGVGLDERHIFAVVGENLFQLGRRLLRAAEF